MDKYRAALKTRLVLYGVLLVATYAAVGIVTLGGDGMAYRETHSGSFIQGFGTGLLIGLTAVTAVFLIQGIRALRDRERLKTMYIKATDERGRMIRDKTAGTAFWTSMGGVTAGAIVAGYINETVSITLIAVLFLMGVTACALKVYYAHRL